MCREDDDDDEQDGQRKSERKDDERREGKRETDLNRPDGLLDSDDERKEEK